MNNQIDVVGILKYLDESRKGHNRSEARKKPEQPLDLMGMLRQRYDENRILEQFFKDVEKINKKEPDKKGLLKLSTEQIQMWLLLAFVATAPLYVLLFLKFAH